MQSVGGYFMGHRRAGCFVRATRSRPFIITSTCDLATRGISDGTLFCLRCGESGLTSLALPRSIRDMVVRSDEFLPYQLITKAAPTGRYGEALSSPLRASFFGSAPFAELVGQLEQLDDNGRVSCGLGKPPNSWQSDAKASLLSIPRRPTWPSPTKLAAFGWIQRLRCPRYP